MASSYVGHVSTNSKHYESTQKAIPRSSSLGLDLRFEQTYLKSIAPYVRSTTPTSTENKGRVDPQGQRLEIKWGMVIWITTRDQVFAPLFQGVIWYVSVSPPHPSFVSFFIPDVVVGETYTPGCNTSVAVSPHRQLMDTHP